MAKEYRFDKKEDFLDALRDFIKKGIPKKHITTLSPYPVHEVDEILRSAPSTLRFFALLGAVAGLIAGFSFTIYTVLSWPLITGGKPLISIPAFIIIAFELTILFGAITAFTGFLHLSRLPSFPKIAAPIECGSQFVIIIHDEES
jgi:hypothetical protein